MIIEPKQLFLLDGFGAILTSVIHGVVLTAFSESFGIPKSVFLALALLVSLYAVYSFTCHSRFEKLAHRWKFWLRGIAIANLFFCVITLGLIIYFYETLTTVGLLYFIGEIVVIIGIAVFELKTASNQPS
jgi:hypothetical protein